VANPSGYSGTPLPKKLGLAAGQRAWLVSPPPDHPESWGELPEGFAFQRRPRRSTPLDVVVVFVTEARVLARDLPAYLGRIERAGMIWVAWPKKAPAKGFVKIDSDITEDLIRELALPLGLVDVKVCAIDGSWSGLKLVIRKELR
jgi:hypothetical protein